LTTGDIPILNQNTTGTASNVTGIVAVANGGTNSSTALDNNRVMISNSGSIVEASAGISGQYLKSNGVSAPSWSTPLGYSINVQALSSSPNDGQTIYFGSLPKHL